MALTEGDVGDDAAGLVGAGAERQAPERPAGHPPLRDFEGVAGDDRGDELVLQRPPLEFALQQFDRIDRALAVGDEHDRTAVIVVLHVIMEGSLDVAISASEDRIGVEAVEHAAHRPDGAGAVDRRERPADAGIAGELDLDSDPLFHARRQIGVEAGVARHRRVEIEAIDGSVGRGMGDDRGAIAVRAKLDRVRRRAGVVPTGEAHPVRRVRIVGGTGRPF